MVHELGHAAMFSYNLLPAIHRFVKPNRWIEAEEWVCNFIADYGDDILDIADSILSSGSFPVNGRMTETGSFYHGYSA